MANGVERRTSRRFSMNLPLVVRRPNGETEAAEVTTETRDVSFRGLYFHLNGDFEICSHLEFFLTLPKEITMAGDVQFRGVGEVVRVEKHESKRGIAARIEKYEIVPAVPA